MIFCTDHVCIFVVCAVMCMRACTESAVFIAGINIVQAIDHRLTSACRTGGGDDVEKDTKIQEVAAATAARLCVCTRFVLER